MKWLATFILCLFPFSVTAQEQQQLPPGTVLLPLVTLCSPIEPAEGLFKKYGEVGFIDGDAMFYIPGNKTVNGKITLYMKPGFDENTYTLMFNVGPMHCMISSGKNVLPVDNDIGDPS